MSALTVAYGFRGALTVFSAIIMNIFAFRVMLKEPLWLSSAGERTQRHVQRRRQVLKTTKQLTECDVSLLTKADEPAGTAFSIQKLLHEAHRRSISNLEAETVDTEEDVSKTEICFTEHDILSPMKDACSKHSEEFMFAFQGFKKSCVTKVDRSESLLSDKQDAQARLLLGPTNSLTSPDAHLDELSQDNTTEKQSPQVCLAYRKIDKDVTTMAREYAGGKPAASKAIVSTISRQLLLRALRSIVPTTSSTASFIAAVLASMLLDYVNSVHLFTMVDYARDKGVSHTHASMALTYAAAPEIFGRLLLPYIADIGWVSRPSLACACTIAAGIVFGVTPETQQVMHLVVRALSSVLMAVLLTMRQVLVADYMGPEAINLVSGVSGSLLVPVLLCNPMIFGYFRDRMGTYDNLYRIVAGIICGAGLVLFVYLFRSNRSKRTTIKSSTGAL
nr:uncharacterized protein LOC126540427 isoform X1 [Dermacentor andersoni]